MASQTRQNSTINILEVIQLNPPADSPIEFTLPLTFFDLLLLKVPLVRHLFFYSLPVPESTWSFEESSSAEEFMKDGGFEFVIQRPIDAIEKLDSDPLADMEKKVVMFMGLIKAAMAGEVIVVYVFDSPRFGFYGLDFGRRRPELVEFLFIDRGRVIGLAESRDDSGGVEVGLSMKKLKMKHFVQLFMAGLES